MKLNSKIKRIMALIAAIALVLLYALTIFFAIADDARTMSYFKASIALTFLIPVFIYANQVVYRVLKGKGSGERSQDEGK